MSVCESESLDYKRGESDGRKDGSAGVRPLSLEIMKRHYSTSYQQGYKAGYDKANEPRRMRQTGAI